MSEQLRHRASPDAVRHDGHLVQRGLAVEEHHVAVVQMPLNRGLHSSKFRLNVSALRERGGGFRVVVEGGCGGCQGV